MNLCYLDPNVSIFLYIQYLLETKNIILFKHKDGNITNTWNTSNIIDDWSYNIVYNGQKNFHFLPISNIIKYYVDYKKTIQEIESKETISLSELKFLGAYKYGCYSESFPFNEKYLKLDLYFFIYDNRISLRSSNAGINFDVKIEKFRDFLTLKNEFQVIIGEKILSNWHNINVLSSENIMRETKNIGTLGNIMKEFPHSALPTTCWI